MKPKHPEPELHSQTEAEFLANAPILATLKARLDSSRTARDWAIANAQQALYLVRTHRIDEAIPVPDQIRTQFRGREEPEVYYWVWLLEAVLDFYQTGATQGKQKIQRAMLMAKSLKRQDLEEYLAAWSAHFCFTNGEYEEMVRWLKISNLANAVLPEAACRASLVVAVARQTCGDDLLAIKWFGIAREIARKIGDRATIMASITNRGAIRLNDIWIEHFRSGEISENVRDVSNELLGGLGYEQITGSDAFMPQAYIFRTRLAYLQANNDLALLNIDKIAGSIRLDSYSILDSTKIFAVWLRAVKLNQEVKFEIFEDKLEQAINSMDSDDAAVSWRMLAGLAKSQGRIDLESKFQTYSNHAFAVYDADRISLANIIKGLN